jgi:Flp pilus assembly protein TadG
MTLRIRKWSISRHLDALLRGEQGIAAVEFALISPVLVLMMLTLFDVSDMAVGSTNMQAAVRATTQYFINGQTDTTAAQTQGTNAWVSMPAGATLTATTACTCAGVGHACDVSCDDGTQPATFYTVTATATLGGSIVSSSKTYTETVRTQ